MEKDKSVISLLKYKTCLFFVILNMTIPLFIGIDYVNLCMQIGEIIQRMLSKFFPSSPCYKEEKFETMKM